MGKLSDLRSAVNNVLLAQQDIALQSEGWVHLYGVSQAAALLASARGLDADTCASAGLLHDIHTFRTGEEKDHAQHGAAEAAAMLRGIAGYPEEEVSTIVRMILCHSDKQGIDGPMEECLKDADVFAHWLNDMGKKFDVTRKARLVKVFGEIGINGRIMSQ